MVTNLMQAWWKERGALHFGPRARPRLVAPDDVRVEVVIAGLCRTDVAVARGELDCAEPCVLGHEIAGVVNEVGPAVSHLRPGDRVACLPRVGADRLGVDRDGGFAEAIVLPAHALVPVPSDLDWRRAAFVEPVAACLAVKHAPLAGWVSVLGGGRIALLTKQIVKELGHRLVDGDDPADPPCDVVIETAGTASSLAQAMRRVREGGLIVLKSRPPAPIPLDVAAAVARGLRFQAVGWAGFDEAFALLRQLRTEDLLGAVHPLEALQGLFEAPEDVKHFVAPNVARALGAHTDGLGEDRR